MEFDYGYDPNRETLQEYANRLFKHQEAENREAAIFRVAADGYLAQSEAALVKARKILKWMFLLLIPAFVFSVLSFIDGPGWILPSLLFSGASITVSFWHRKALRNSNEARKNYRDLKFPK